MTVLDSDLLAEFLEEAEEGVSTLNEDLLFIEDELNQGLKVNSESINEMFRVAHSIKGASAFFSLKKINGLTHELESLMDLFRVGVLLLTKEHTDLIFKTLDILNKLFLEVRKEGIEKTEIDSVLLEIKKITSSIEAEQKKPIENINKVSPVSDYLNEFTVETEDNINSLNDSLLLLEKEPNDENELNNAFRLSHTIKGSAGLLGYSEINKLMHALEDLLAMVRSKKFVLNSSLISFSFKLVDQVEKALLNLKKNGEESINVESILSEFKTAVSQVQSGNVNSESFDEKKEASSTSEKVYKVTVYVEGSTSLKSIRAILIMKKLSEVSEIVSITPNIDQIDSIESSEDLPIVYIVKTKVDKKDLSGLSNVDTVNKVIVEDFVEKKNIVENIQADFHLDEEAEHTEEKNNEKIQINDKHIEDIRKKVSIIQTVRVDIRKLDNLMNLAGELVITKAIYGQLLGKLQKYMVNVTEQMSRMTSSLNKLDSFISSNNTKKISELMGEVKDMYKDISSDDFFNVVTQFDDNTSRLGKISGDIQSDVMFARMVPIYGVFNRFKRVIRDLSVELNKEVKLEISGEETELDKKIIDEISDPLTHMVRNAMDHGFESKEVRLSSGKEPYGILKLEASHKGNSVYVSVSDDGRGIDPKKVVNKALSKGLITAEKLELMTDKEKINLVFLPGFSLAEQVTSLSGRGVGMDVVLKMVENVGGSISIDSELGKGTNIAIKIPLTLAIIKALLVNIGSQIYAFPLDTVTEVVKMPDSEIYSIDGNDAIKLRGAPIALLELKKLIGIDSDIEVDKNIQDNKVVVVIISDGNTHVGIRVDSLIGGEEIVIKSLSEHFNDVIGISGASILGNGAIAQIFDVGAIIKAAE